MKLLKDIDILVNYGIIFMNVMIRLSPGRSGCGGRYKRDSASDCPHSSPFEKRFKSLDSTTAVFSIALRLKSPL